MALVRKLSEGHQRIKPHSTEVDCYFQTLTDQNGSTLLHLSTFGSDSRESAPKSSQTLQIDREIASELVDLLVGTFRLPPRTAGHDVANQP